MEEENKKVEAKKSNNKLSITIMVIAVFILGIGIGLFFAMPNNSNKSNSESGNNNENKETNDNTDNTPIDNSVDFEKIVEPFLIFSKCGGAEYLRDELTYDTIDSNAKIDIAYNHLLGDKYAEKELNKSDLIQAYKEVFGSDKVVELPDELNISYAFATYKLNGEVYNLEGQGGGCIGISDIFTKTELDSNNNNELVIKVKYVYVTTISDSIEDFDNTELGVYNSKNKERLIRQGFILDKMKEVANEVLSGEETDYVLYTFKLDNGNYIFDNAKIIKR